MKPGIQKIEINSIFSIMEKGSAGKSVFNKGKIEETIRV